MTNSNRKSDRDGESLFVLRRAWVKGVCKRTDLDKVFGTTKSPNRAQAILEKAIKDWPKALVRIPYKGVYAKTSVARPKETEATVILDLIAKRAPPQETGIFPHEGIPRLFMTPKPSRAMNPRATQVLLSAALQQTPVRVLYVGLRRKEEARWRNLWPRALEHTGLFWRLHAQDMDDADHGYPIKTYILGRVMEAEPLPEKSVPKKFVPKIWVRHERRLRVSLSEGLSDDQILALCNQFDIQNGVMEWPEHGVYGLRREFSDAPVPEGVVWPPMTSIRDEGEA